MHTKFIHILLFMMAAASFMASCTSEVPDNGVKSGPEMQFAASEVSRASVSTNLNYAGSRFAIFGDMKLADSSSPKNIVIFNGVSVTYDNSKWTYANPQYWFPKHEYSFVAVHPAEVDGVFNTTYSGSSLSFGYTLPEAFGDTSDLLVATHRRMYEKVDTSSPATPVILGFIHAMSRINFQVKCDGAADIIKVTKIEFEGVNKSGTFTITPAPLSGNKQTDDYELSWADFSDESSLVADIEVEIPDTETNPLFPDDNALFVIPQPDNEGIIVKITYTLTYKNGRTEERTLATATPIGGWKQGKVYTYSLSIKAEAKVIEMNVSVEDWKAGPVDDVQVPRK